MKFLEIKQLQYKVDNKTKKGTFVEEKESTYINLSMVRSFYKSNARDDKPDDYEFNLITATGHASVIGRVVNISTLMELT